MNIARLFTQSVSVRTFLGDGSNGPAYSDPVTVACFVNDRRQIVRGRDGEETTSETTLYAPLATYPTFTPGSDVTVNDLTAQVISVYKRDSAGPATAHHVQVTLT